MAGTLRRFRMPSICLRQNPPLPEGIVMLGYILIAIVAFDAGFLAASILAASGRSHQLAARIGQERQRKREEKAPAVS